MQFIFYILTLSVQFCIVEIIVLIFQMRKLKLQRELACPKGRTRAGTHVSSCFSS